MGKRSRSSRRAGLDEKRPVGSSDLLSAKQTKRRLPWAVVLLAATVGLTVVAVSSVAVYHSWAADRGTDAARTQEIEELIRRYFRTWSDQDMKGYGECFLKNSSIQYIDAQGNIEQYALPTFLKYQADLLSRGEHEKEVPESIEIHFEAKLARVVVYWKLTTGTTEVFGYDHFVLLKNETDGKWGIVNLVFYETKRSG